MRVTVKHRNGFQRIVGEVLADQAELVQDFRRNGDDVASGGLSLKNVQQLARAGPQQLSTGACDKDLTRLLHDGDGIDSSVGNASCEY